MARRHRYRNPWPGSIEHGPAAVVRWLFEGRKSAQGSERPAPRFPIATASFERPRAEPGTLTATWIGHATTLLQVGPLNVLTDPMWSERASPLQFLGPRRRTAPGVALEELPPIDLVLISHDHYDHLDRRTVGRLLRHSPDVRWAAPVGVGRYLKKFGATAIGEHGWWDRETASDLGVSVACTPARHFSGRTPWRRNNTLWCGWILRAHGHSVFFAGDTARHPEFGEIARRFGPFDLSLMPIGAYQPQWMMKPVHMNPEEAVESYGDVAAVHRERGWAPPAMLPIHWGTFKLSDEPLDEPPRRLTTAWTAAGHDSQSLWLLQHGETRARRQP
jgi:L-ascorbate metabolism protein UlaG (beta-lactamase superfamily)